MAAAGVLAARSEAETAATREFIERVMGFRPGLPLLALGTLLGVLALTIATWFAPQQDDATLVDTSSLFAGSGVSGLTGSFLGWLGYVLFLVVVLVAAAAVWTGQKMLGYLAAAVAAVTILITISVLYDISKTAAAGHPGAGGPWQDLGTGGWLLCIAVFSLGSAGIVAARRVPASRRDDRYRPRRDQRQPPAAPADDVLDDAQHRAVRDRAGAVLPADGDRFWQTGAGLRDRRLRAAGHRPQRRRRLGRPARPRVHRVLRHRLLHHGVPDRLAAGQAARLAA